MINDDTPKPKELGEMFFVLASDYSETSNELAIIFATLGSALLDTDESDVVFRIAQFCDSVLKEEFKKRMLK